MPRILVIDDEEKLRGLLKRILSLEGFEVSEADSLKTARRLLEKEEPAVVLCDVKLPDGKGVEFVQELKSRLPYSEVILLTAYGNIPDSVAAIKNGAFDYLIKGDDNDRIIPLLHRALEKAELQQRIRQLEQLVGKRYSFDSIIGESPAIRKLIELAGKVAPTDATVLLLGETGTGKEVFAQAIHQASRYSSQPFVAVNCSAFSKDLLESEIFGHKAGAFTGAVKDKKGLIEEAAGGTLFLDEIGEMQHELQAKLLRVLESGEFIKVGDTRAIKVKVRIIAATNRNLEEEVQKGHFREDLFYRLNVFTLELPSLRDRRKDIPLLAAYYLQSFAAKVNRRINGISDEAMQCLQHHDWKGNIRELKNVIERAVILEESDRLSAESLPADIRNRYTGQESGALSAFHLASAEKLHIQKVLNHTQGNKTEAARLLGIGLATLYRKIDEYHLKK